MALATFSISARLRGRPTWPNFTDLDPLDEFSLKTWAPFVCDPRCGCDPDLISDYGIPRTEP
jgi:hypothetical protein